MSFERVTLKYLARQGSSKIEFYGNAVKMVLDVVGKAVVLSLLKSTVKKSPAEEFLLT